MCANGKHAHQHGSSSRDEIVVEIMDDGFIKITTNQFSPANHGSAEQAVKFLTDLLGGPVNVSRNKERNIHTHVERHLHVSE